MTEDSMATLTFPASFMQQALWLAGELAPDSSFYNIPWVLSLPGPADRAAVQAALTKVVMRHEALRTTFATDDGLPVQVVSSQPRLILEEHDLRDLSLQVGEEHFRELCALHARTSFDLARGPLLRAAVAHLCGGKQALLFTAHHIVADARSMEIVASELLTLLADPQADLPEPALQFADFAIWERQRLSGEALQDLLTYWSGQLDDVPLLLRMPTDQPRRLAFGYATQRCGLGLSQRSVRALAALAKQHGASTFMVLLAATGVLLARQSGQPRLLIGVPVSSRNRTELENLVGPLINTLALRVDVSDDPSFPALLARLRAVVLDGLENQHLPFAKLVEHVNPPRDPGTHPIVQVLLEAPEGPVTLPQAAGVPAVTDTGNGDADLRFVFDLASPENSFLHYRTGLFDSARITDLVGQLGTLISGILDDANRPVSRLPLLSRSARRRALARWAETPSQPPAHSGIHMFVESQARRSPDAVAVVSGHRHLSYRELSHQSSQLARQLLARGLHREDRVGICAGRSLELAVAILAVLKAGGVIVPLDPELPAARNEFILDDAKVTVVLAEPDLRARIRAVRPVIPVSLTERPAGRDPGLPAYPGQLALILYTSGSTGQPKGVMLSHRGLINYALWCLAEFGAGPGCRVPLHGSIGFDTTVITSLLPPLFAGGCVDMIDEGPAVQAIASLAAPATTYSYLALTPTQLNLLAERRTHDPASPQPAALLVVGGEAVREEHLKRWRAGGITAPIVNEYGPTETVAASCAYRIPKTGQLPDSIPIGLPIAATSIRVLDQGQQPVPPGVPGELCIGGAGVARGYVGRPGHTATSFLPDAFAASPGARMYRTGDQVRYRADGVLEFVGRIDDQVKIRGQRVELAEVEAAVMSHASVQACAVLATGNGDGETVLSVFAVPGDPRLTPRALQDWLSDLLPRASLPSRYALIGKLPTLPSGKIDRKALAAIPTRPPVLSADSVAPRTDAEAALVAVWREILGAEQVGVLDNFFELGGHSLAAASVLARIRDVLGVSLELQQFFEEPTVAGLARRIGSRAKKETGALVTLPASVPRSRQHGLLPLSYAQEAIWFSSLLRPGHGAYYTSDMYRILGPLQGDHLLASIDALLSRHDLLRMAVVTEGGRPFLAPLGPDDTRIRMVDLAGLPEAEQWRRVRELVGEEAGRPFDLRHESGPLLRAALFRLQPDDHVLVLVFHHLVVDGRSTEIILHDLGELYVSRLRGISPALSQLTTTYRDFTAWERGYLRGDVLRRQLDYWERQLDQAPTEIAFATDPHIVTGPQSGGRHICHLPPELCERLEKLSSDAGVTLFMTVLAGFGILLSRYAHTDDVVVAVPIDRRSRPGTEHVVGLFVNILPMRLRIPGQLTPRRLLRQVYDTVAGAFAHRDLPFSKLVEAAPGHRTAFSARGRFPQVLFNLQHGPSSVLSLTGLHVEPVETPFPKSAPADLALSADYIEGNLRTEFAFDLSVFSPEKIRRMAPRLGSVLNAMANAPDSRVDDIPLSG